MILALAWRHRAILTLCAAIALKVGIHAVTVSQGRYFLPVTAMEILAIALGGSKRCCCGGERASPRPPSP